MKSIRITELQLVARLYPRRECNEEHIERLSDAVRQGCKLPPIVVEAETNIVVDGMHRYHAYLKVYGAKHIALCCEKRYASEAALFQDAVRLNRTHGLPIATSDYKLIVERATALGISDDGVKGLLHIPASRVDAMLRSALPKSLQKAPEPQQATPLVTAKRVPGPSVHLCVGGCGRPSMAGKFRCMECLREFLATQENEESQSEVPFGRVEPIGFYAAKIATALRCNTEWDKQTVESLEELHEELERFFIAAR